MEKSTVTAKGQVTIPPGVRERLSLRPGDQIEFVEENGIYRIRKLVTLETIRKYRGYLKHLAGYSSDELVEEMRGR